MGVDPENAKDVSIQGKVRVLIEADLDSGDAHVTFKQNGGAFSPENIRFLIEQVSSKERTNDNTGPPTTTGRFGTGFLTTTCCLNASFSGRRGGTRLRAEEVQAVA